ncbi:hypothetical protein QUN67_004912, partial [Salmonella enterica subsp. enterica serovar Typhimurium]|nr:hypothetical protein [Salmonella enterica subsp. enterica serovar Typhimurium]
HEPEWKVEKQPRWLVAAIKKTISSLHGGYEEAAEWLDVTKDALFNRLRTGGDQIFPIGWALVLQRAGGTYHLAHSVARASGGVFVPLADMEEVDNADINQRLLEAIEQITSYSQQIRVAIEDGVIEPHEKAVIDEELYQAIAKLQQHSTLVYRVFCVPE